MGGELKSLQFICPFDWVTSICEITQDVSYRFQISKLAFNSVMNTVSSFITQNKYKDIWITLTLMLLSLSAYQICLTEGFCMFLEPIEKRVLNKGASTLDSKSNIIY